MVVFVLQVYTKSNCGNYCTSSIINLVKKLSKLVKLNISKGLRGLVTQNTTKPITTLHYVCYLINKEVLTDNSLHWQSNRKSFILNKVSLSDAFMWATHHIFLWTVIQPTNDITVSDQQYSDLMTSSYTCEQGVTGVTKTYTNSEIELSFLYSN